MRKLFTFFIIFLMVLQISGPVMDPDLWWHIVIGKWILAHGFPTVDQWNMYSQGIFRAYSWFPEVIFALIDKYFGVIGFLYLKVVLGLILGLTLVFILQKLSKDNFMGVILGVMTLMSFAQFFTLRPQIISWLCFAISIYLAQKIYEDGWTKKRYIEVFLTFVLLSNSNITQALSLFIFVMWGFNGFNKNLIKLLFVPFLATLCTPYFGGEWITFFTKSNHPMIFNRVAEFQSANICNISFDILIMFGCFAIMLWHFYDNVINKVRLCAIFILIIAGGFVIKLLPYANITLAATISILWATDCGRKVWNINEALERLKKLSTFFEGVGAAFLLLCLVIISFNKLLKDENNKINKVITPINAVKFIKDNNLKFPLLNHFDEGGYLIYSFSNDKGEPTEKFPIDGRTNVMSPKVYNLFLKSLNGKEGWQDYINFVNANTILWPNSSPLVRILNMDKENWCRVFNEKREKGFSIFIKRGINDTLCLN